MKKRTRELAITKDVKSAVAERDSVDGWPCCILCGRPAPTSDPLAFSCCHYINRSQGGRGIEENIMTLCPRCHSYYDGAGRNKHRPYLRRYLMDKYPDWSEGGLVYEKNP